MKNIIIIPELALTISLLEPFDAGLFIMLLIDYTNGEKGIDPEDYTTPMSRALKYWFKNIDQITVGVKK